MIKKCSNKTCLDPIKNEECFNWSNKKKSRRQSWCIDCRSKSRKTNEYRKHHLEQIYKDKAVNPEKYTRISLRNKGTSLEEYNQILKEQGGVCAICKTSELPKSRSKLIPPRFHVDHDHRCCPGIKSCGQCVRGLLCSACNTGLGMFKDSWDIVMNLVGYIIDNRYLRQFRDEHPRMEGFHEV